MPMVFALQATTKEFVDERAVALEQEAEERERKAAELANLAEVVRCHDKPSIIILSTLQ